jgi:hypothetical protein
MNERKGIMNRRKRSPVDNNLDEAGPEGSEGASEDAIVSEESEGVEDAVASFHKRMETIDAGSGPSVITGAPDPFNGLEELLPITVRSAIHLWRCSLEDALKYEADPNLGFVVINRNMPEFLGWFGKKAFSQDGRIHFGSEVRDGDGLSKHSTVLAFYTAKTLAKTRKVEANIFDTNDFQGVRADDRTNQPGYGIPVSIDSKTTDDRY